MSTHQNPVSGITTRTDWQETLVAAYTEIERAFGARQKGDGRVPIEVPHGRSSVIEVASYLAGLDPAKVLSGHFRGEDWIDLTVAMSRLMDIDPISLETFEVRSRE